MAPAQLRRGDEVRSYWGKDKFLKLASLRFIRACIGQKDDFYNRYLVKNKLLDPVFALFKSNGSRDNLINSAVIDLVDFIRTENVKSLVEHIVETYGEGFKDIDYVETFKSIILKYEQNLELRGGAALDIGDSNGASNIAEAHRTKVD